MVTHEDIYLKTPDLSDESILGYKVGIRPYRHSGVRLEAEYINQKLMIHNYGYGGSGLTLCWGGAQEVMRILQEEQEKNLKIAQVKNIAVLGAGVIGLATAYELLVQGFQVNIYAAAFSPNLTSNVAAGILSAPSHIENMPIKQKEMTKRMLDVSLARFTSSATSLNPEFSGVKYLLDYRFEANDHESNAFFTKFQDISTDEKKVNVHFDNGMIKTGRQVRELGLDGKLFIDDLSRLVQTKGAQLYQRYFDNVGDILKLNENIIVNCTSIGSQIIFNDKDFLPIRGHLIDFKQQEGIDYSFYQALPQEKDYWVKLYPWSDRMILGGVFETNVQECEVDSAVINRLLKYARSCF